MNLPDEKKDAREKLALLAACTDAAGTDPDRWEAVKQGCLTWVINHAHLFVNEAAPEQRGEDHIVPGEMHCAKCKFKLFRKVLNVAMGAVGMGTNETEPCPNGCGPLWPVTWKQLAYDQGEQINKLWDENKILKSALGYHINADAYRDSFPDDEADAASLKKQETWNRLTARSLLTEDMEEDCNRFMKDHAMSQPDMVETVRAAQASLKATRPEAAADSGLSPTVVGDDGLAEAREKLKTYKFDTSNYIRTPGAPKLITPEQWQEYQSLKALAAGKGDAPDPLSGTPDGLVE